MIMIDAPRRGTDWFSQLKDDEKEEKDGKTVVYLKGLRRLADIAGKTREDVKFGNAFAIQSEGGFVLFAQIAYTAEFRDGTTWTGTADCNSLNCEKLWHYPTSVAESRAEARALRKALGISQLSKEEISDAPLLDQVNLPIESQQVRFLTTLAKRKNIDEIDIIKKITKRKGIVELKDLNFEEGQQAAIWLNKQSDTKK